MNRVFLLGRLTKDPEVRYSQTDSNMAIARFTVAINRRGNDAGADFINCVAFGKQGELVEKYFAKGSRIGIVGHIITGSYINHDGAKIYTTEVAVDELHFIDSKSDAPQQSAPSASTDGFEPIQEELPFA